MIVQTSIEQKLIDHFNPDHLEVTNESGMHNVPVGSETHFKVLLVTKRFVGERLINRHRAVNKVLEDELANDIHALALHTYTAEEWRNLYDGAPDSPNCLGGGTRKAS